MKKPSLRPPDWLVFVLAAALTVFGWVILYSASALVAESRYGDQYYFLKKQMVWSCLGLAGLLAAQRVSLSFLQRNARLILAGVVVLLALVLVVGHEAGGAKRWLRVAGVGFQPSEFAKLALVVALADYLDRKQSRLGSFWKGFAPPMAVMGLVAVLIALEPDLGTPMLIVLAGVGMAFLAGARFRHLLLSGLLAMPVLYFEIFRVPYRRQRLMAFLDPWKESQGTGYQLVQSFLALGSGGLFGRGSGESVIKRYYLPESQTDFIFAILGEELGFLGAAAVTAAFFFLSWRSFRIASRASNLFEALLAAGIGLLIGGQALINLCVVTGLAPTKGIPLPFISFGGSSLVLTLVSVGLLVNVSRRRDGSLLARQRRPARG
ncbi:MAG: putative lipid II flippase FtsW [Elusimicrobiota bacterium]